MPETISSSKQWQWWTKTKIFNISRASWQQKYMKTFITH